MKKADFLQPGEYGVYPQAVLRRGDLTATAKLVYIALVDCLRGDDESVYPQVAAIQKMTACGRTAVLQGLAALEAKGFLRCERQNGARSVYSFTPPDAWAADQEKKPKSGTENVPVMDESGPESGPATQESGTENVPVLDESDSESGPDKQKSGAENGPATQESGTESEPVQNPNRSGKHTAPVRKTNRTGTENGPPLNVYSEHSEETKTPPTPPQAGGDFPVALTLAEAKKRMAAACCEAIGSYPAGFNRQLRRFFDESDGDVESQKLLAAVAAADVLAGWHKAHQNGGVLKVRHILAAVTDRLALEAERERKARLQAGRDAEQQQEKNAAATVTMTAEAARMKFFDSLPADDRERFRREVSARPFAPKKAELLDRLAALLAWTARGGGVDAGHPATT